MLWIGIYSRAEGSHHSTFFIVSFEHILHLFLVFLLLILSMYVIAGFVLAYFSRFYIMVNSSLIVYSFLESISMQQNTSTKWNVHPLPPCFLVKTRYVYEKF